MTRRDKVHGNGAARDNDHRGGKGQAPEAVLNQAPPRCADPEDPMGLVGVAVPGAQLEDMARVLVEEYALMGWGEERLMTLFTNPFYRLPHNLYRSRGQDHVRALIASVLGGPATEDAPGPHPEGGRHG